MAIGDLLAIGPSDEFRVDSSGGIVSLASTANGDGAALIGVEDSAGDLAATTVEAALAELAVYLPREIADPGDAGAVPVTRSGVCHLVTAGAETRTVADPAAVGLRLTLYFLTDGGNAVVTFASPINVAGNTIATFADAGDTIDLVSARDGASAYHWHIVGNDGAVALS